MLEIGPVSSVLEVPSGWNVPHGQHASMDVSSSRSTPPLALYTDYDQQTTNHIRRIRMRCRTCRYEGEVGDEAKG